MPRAISTADAGSSRRELERLGVVLDPFLDTDPDCPVYGINLTCAYPLAPHLKVSHENLRTQLRALGEGLYLYPFEQMHVTVMTFVSFARHRHPTPELREELIRLGGEVIDLLTAWFAEAASGWLHPFTLEFGAPVLSPRAGFLPVANPSGEIARLRGSVMERLGLDPCLEAALQARGLSVPGIIHSTLLRFPRAPANLAAFLRAFDSGPGQCALGSALISEMLVTAEVRPYMRGVEVLRRFPLA